jgi:hypothetical protein
MKKYGSNKTYGSNKPNLSSFGPSSGVRSSGFSAFPSFVEDENLSPAGVNIIRAPTSTKDVISLYNDADEDYNPGKAKKKRTTSEKVPAVTDNSKSQSTDTSFSSVKGTGRQRIDKKAASSNKSK